jgi:hypothetical protein
MTSHWRRPKNWMTRPDGRLYSLFPTVSQKESERLRTPVHELTKSRRARNADL